MFMITNVLKAYPELAVLTENNTDREEEFRRLYPFIPLTTGSFKNKYIYLKDNEEFIDGILDETNNQKLFRAEVLGYDYIGLDYDVNIGNLYRVAYKYDNTSYRIYSA